MTSLAHFSAEEAELLVSLPYRIGVHMSHIDDEEGEIDDKREMASLESCIRSVAALRQQDRPFVSEVMRETLRLRYEWLRWAENSLAVYKDAERAISLLKLKAGEKTARSYAASLMEIAAAVARAYGEFSTFAEEERKSGIMGALFSKIIEGFSELAPEDEGHPMNVSASENEALARLSAALKV